MLRVDDLLAALPGVDLGLWYLGEGHPAPDIWHAILFQLRDGHRDMFKGYGRNAPAALVAALAEAGINVEDDET